MPRSSIQAAVCLALLASCSPSGASLDVELETDFVAGRDFTHVRVEVNDRAYGSDLAVPGAMEIPSGTSSYVPSRRVAEFGAVASGEHVVRVRLLDAMGDPVVTRLIHLRLDGPFLLTVVISRDCAGITCPDPDGDPAFTTCFRGQCTSPSCGEPGAPACPTSQCTVDTDCVPTSACVVPTCDRGVCLQVGDDGACPPTERCDPTLGCVLREGVTPDAGQADASPGDACPTTETACTDGMDDDCDHAIDCADSDCSGIDCDDGLTCTVTDRCAMDGACAGLPMDCDDGIACTTDACAEGTGCTHTPSDALCMDMAGGHCDAASGCQYPTCSAATCVAVDACDTATCVGTTCTHTPACTTGQTCCGGACHPTACSDGNPCTDDSFDTTTCACRHVNNTAACSDGSACTTGDRCAAGRCAGTTRNCDDGNACTTDGCSAATGCTHAARPTGTSCGTNSACCSGTCRSLAGTGNCGACGTTCAAGRSCVTVPGRSGVFTCTCGSNSECRSEGFGSIATCYSGYCDCQCSAAEPTTCGGQCGSGATCHELSGHNYCQYP